LLHPTSDGCYSQFGIEHGKKMMKHHFKGLLSSIGQLPMMERHFQLKAQLSAWPSKEEQVDDMLVIGIGL